MSQTIRIRKSNLRNTAIRVMCLILLIAVAGWIINDSTTKRPNENLNTRASKAWIAL